MSPAFDIELTAPHVEPTPRRVRVKAGDVRLKRPFTPWSRPTRDRRE